jgi:hypothetical protein
MKDFFGDEKYKKIMLVFWIALITALIAFVAIFVAFSQKLKSTADLGLLTINTTTSVVPNDETTKEASYSSDKNINEVANEVLNQISNSTSTSRNNSKYSI